jgi:hypothetical protein
VPAAVHSRPIIADEWWEKPEQSARKASQAVVLAMAGHGLSSKPPQFSEKNEGREITIARVAPSLTCAQDPPKIKKIKKDIMLAKDDKKMTPFNTKRAQDERQHTLT